MGMLMIRCPKTGRAISTGRHIESRFFSTPLYFSAAPTVHTAGRGMSGLSKTHGFAIPTRLNVNSWGRRRRAVRLRENPGSTALNRAEGQLKRCSV